MFVYLLTAIWCFSSSFCYLKFYSVFTQMGIILLQNITCWYHLTCRTLSKVHHIHVLPQVSNCNTLQWHNCDRSLDIYLTQT